MRMGVSLAMITTFLPTCNFLVWRIFTTGYELKS